MNRLVIIGNGFDLAHGLPTKYSDFIDDLWRRIAESPDSYTDLVEIDNQFYKFIDGKIINNYSDFLKSIEDYMKNSINHYSIINWDKEGAFVVPIGESTKKYFFRITNYFFDKICGVSINNWVDIENEYYKILKECLKESNNEVITTINEQFNIIKDLLETYLVEKVEDYYVFSKDSVEEFVEIFNKCYYEKHELDRFLTELSNKDVQVIKDGFDKFEKEFLSPGDIPKQELFKDELSLDTYFLSFNYTTTVFNYSKLLGLDLDSLNEIHGRLDDKSNPINFGFGDEMDKQYQEIEEKDDNEYLKNIKSFQYLHTSNYKRLLDLIDSDIYQVYIMGHSCGLSDRTLLNTVFEHNNCRSIKIFYHETKDEHGKIVKDNYTEITQNISRHFNKKKLMREKIVNKTLCQPLPQIQLPLK